MVVVNSVVAVSLADVGAEVAMVRVGGHLVEVSEVAEAMGKIGQTVNKVNNSVDIIRLSH